ncbi:hypothetical protein [Tabrizicola sp.]|uniref:hypothetical protein n=1 Tax=Tabrizicola sp. TaxID=2005166 RepID=UPI002736E31C|nr:hypothetical protein [Tabrizicola sp.]MDP3194615.1 hypothetical protein [Tabrizicola sp.]
MALATHHQTARLALRPVAASDEAAVLDGIDDLAVSGWLAVVPHPYTAADFRHFLTKIAVPGEPLPSSMDQVLRGSCRSWMANLATG